MKISKLVFAFLFLFTLTGCNQELKRETAESSATDIDLQANTGVFDLDLASLEEYFLLTDTIQYESEYGAGYIDVFTAPEGYVLILDDAGEPKRFSGEEGDYVRIYPEEGYETKEKVSFYLNRVAGPRSELYGPFSADLMSLLEISFEL